MFTLLVPVKSKRHWLSQVIVKRPALPLFTFWIQAVTDETTRPLDKFRSYTFSDLSHFSSTGLIVVAEIIRLTFPA